MITMELTALAHEHTETESRMTDASSPGVTEKSFRDGSMEAFKVLMLRHQQGIYSLGLRFFYNRDRAADFCQEVFIRAYEKRRKYNADLPFKPWLFRLAANYGRDELRKKKVTLMSDTLLPELPSTDRTESSVQRHELNRKIGSVLDKLSSTYREIIALRFSSELSLNEIANVLGISLSAAKVRLCRGVRAFEERFKADGGDEYVV